MESLSSISSEEIESLEWITVNDGEPRMWLQVTLRNKDKHRLELPTKFLQVPHAHTIRMRITFRQRKVCFWQRILKGQTWVIHLEFSPSLIRFG
jgi:hypothetical protein